MDQAKRSGYVRVQIDGSLYELSEEIKLDKNIKHNIEIIVDRLVVKPGIEKRLADSIENSSGSFGRASYGRHHGWKCSDIQSEFFLPGLSDLDLMRSSPGAFPLIILLEPARTVLDLATKWNLTRI